MGNKFAEQVEAGNYSTLWVCTCCMLSHANGECCADDSHGGDGCEPLSKIPATADVSLGMLDAEHNETCLRRIKGWHGAPSDYECDCETVTFSWHSCPGCGSDLGGSRYALFVVYDVREPA